MSKTKWHSKVIHLVVALALVISLGLAIAVQTATPAMAATLTIRPNSAGAYTSITSQSPASGAHWDKVDEASADDGSTYVYTASDTQRKDAYTLEDLSQTGTINSVTVWFRFRSSRNTAAAYCQPFLRLDTNETAGTEQSTQSTTWTTYSETLARPGGGTWSWTDINNLQVCIGLRHTSTSFNRYAQCTQVYVVVNYNNAPSDIPLSPSSVAENQPSGTTVGTLSTTDPDAGDTFTYTLVSGTGDMDNASFNILGNSLRTSASFDYETKNSYNIRVRSTDQGGLWVEKQFTITVTNVNEAPVADSQSGLSVDSCSTLPVTLTGSDPDSDPLTYIISALPTHGDLYDGEGTGGTKITSGMLPYTVTDATHKVTYKPDASYSGSESFGFNVNDGELDSTEATISITVSDSRSTWYQDSDNDTYGNPDVSMLACDQPEGYVDNDDDCDDTDPDVHPGAIEVCNDIDDDCDGLIDDDDPDITGQSTWYQDSDDDGYGNPDVSMLACDQPEGYVANDDDCDDTDPDVHPGATEVPYNGKDDDCNAATPDVIYDLTMAADPEVGGTATDLTGESPYAEGAEVSIKAEANEGYEFANWTATAGVFGNATAAETTFTMPAQNVTVTANFEEVPPPPVYPTVTTQAATNVSVGSATLNMNYTMGNYTSVEVRFAYKKSSDSAWSYTDWVSKTVDGIHAESLTELNSNTEYEFIAQLKYNDTIEGTALQFTTDTSTPPPSGGGCFIATAAYGTPAAEQIDSLREFRDVVLLKSTAGSQFVALYYRFSPPIADFIAGNEILRTLVRELLIDPIVWVVEATGDVWRN